MPIARFVHRRITYLGGLAGRSGGAARSRITGLGCGGNSRSRMGPTGLPIRRSSIWAGSSGRPGCSAIAPRLCAKGTGGGGGVLRVMNRGGVCRAGAAVAGRGGVMVPGRAGAMAPALGLAEEGRCPAGEARGWLRTGGEDRGFPGTAARGVGFATGCGTTCAWDSFSGGTRTACLATGPPLLRTFFGTAVVAMVL